MIRCLPLLALFACDSPSGSQGAQGPAGPQGPAGACDCAAELSELRDRIDQLEATTSPIRVWTGPGTNENPGFGEICRLADLEPGEVLLECALLAESESFPGGGDWWPLIQDGSRYGACKESLAGYVYVFDPTANGCGGFNTAEWRVVLGTAP